MSKTSQDVLRQIKQEALAQERFNPSSNHVVLIPEESIPYSVLVKIMDVTRGKRGQALFSSIAFGSSIQ